MEPEFTLVEARHLLAAARAIAPDGLSAPLTDADIHVALEVGAEVKSRPHGLIDFPTTIGGVPSYWCWQAGEAEIEWWHPRHTGFAGRQLIADLPTSER